jgi:hypothetical protein
MEQMAQIERGLNVAETFVGTEHAKYSLIFSENAKSGRQAKKPNKSTLS